MGAAECVAELTKGSRVASNQQIGKPEDPQSRRSSSGLDGPTDLEITRQRFKDAGKFPVRKFVIYVSVFVVVALLGAGGWSKLQASKQVTSGVMVSDQDSASSGAAMSETASSTAEAPGSASSGDADSGAAMSGSASSGAAMSGSASSGTTTSGNIVTVGMTPIDLTVSGDLASFSLIDVQKSTLASMQYKRTNPLPAEWQSITGGSIPLLAYVAPSGNLVVAISICEPCRSTGFRIHVGSSTLVCDTCFTRWDLNTLEGLSGACMAYPPQILKVQNQNGVISIAYGGSRGLGPATVATLSDRSEGRSIVSGR